MPSRPENTAAVVNGVLVLLAPFALLLVARLLPDSDTSVTVPPSGWSSWLPGRFIVQLFLLMTPFAAIAAWRTWVHARRWLRGEGTGWRGVIEAGVLGLLVVLAVLARDIITRPTEAVPYVLFYGGAGLIVGILVGLVLWTTAVLTLKASAST